MTTTASINFTATAMDPQLADTVRATMVAPDYGHPAHAELATGRAPCRVCLRKFEPGRDRRILFTYDPFRDVAPLLPLPGPMFIHEQPCEPFAGGQVPPALAGDRLTLSAFGADRRPVAESRTAEAGEAAAALARMFSLTETLYVHARSTPNGCFLCRFDRGEAVSG